MDKINYLVQKFQNSGTLSFENIKTTGNRGYNSYHVEHLNKLLDTIPITRRAPILAAAIEESGVNPRAKGSSGEFGIFQMKNDRYVHHPNEKNLTDVELIDWQAKQALEQMKREPQDGNWTDGGSGTGIAHAIDAYNAFYNPNATLEETNNYLNLGFIRPHGKKESATNRLLVTKQIYDILQSQENEKAMLESKSEEKKWWEKLLGR